MGDKPSLARYWKIIYYSYELFKSQYNAYVEKVRQEFRRGGEITKNCMANLPDETVTTVFNLQRRLWELINQTTTAAWVIFEQFGETEETIPELEELRNAAERLTDSYSRLYTLMLRVAESQPSATSAMLNLLDQSIERSQATADASQASVREIKRTWNLP